MTIVDIGEFRARPTVYKGVLMRSRLEARVAAAMDLSGKQWSYEPKAFADERGQYLPDFVTETEGRTHYIETKGWLDDEAVGPVLRRMEIIWASEPDAILSVWEGFPVRRQWYATQHTGWWELPCEGWR